MNDGQQDEPIPSRNWPGYEMRRPLTPTIEMLTTVIAALIGNPRRDGILAGSHSDGVAVTSPGVFAARVAWDVCREHNRLMALHHASASTPSP